MKKQFIRITLLILVMCLLSGCSEPAAEAVPEKTEEVKTEETVKPDVAPEDRYVFTRESFPKMDGSTATVPLGQAIAGVLLGESREEVNDLIQFNKTTGSYRNLMSGNADIIISAEPAEVVLEEKEAQNFGWRMEPFAVDGLVFVVNEDNPIDSLTVEEVRGIYTGHITYWSQLGGDEVEIMPFQRNAESGSQTAMLKHVMKDTPIMEAPKEYTYESMYGLIEGIAAYNDTAASIGYTMYYYAEDMKMADGLKILKIDGVEPNDETIRSGEYPFLNNYYVVTKTHLAEDDPARIMYDWLLSDSGQRLVANEGYVPVMDVGDETGPMPWDTVWTDWSKLDAFENGALYSYLEPRSKDGLLHPCGDYGKLLPYVGASSGEGYDSVRTCGLITDDGQIVTEPVYSDIFYRGNFLVLCREEPVGVEYTESGYARGNTLRKYTIAGANGNWIKDFGNIYTFYMLDKDVMIIRKINGSMTVLGSNGEIISEIPETVFTEHFGEDYLRYYQSMMNLDGYFCLYSDYRNPAADALIIDVYTGEVVTDYPKSKISAPEWNNSSFPEVEGYDDVYRCSDMMTGKDYYEGRILKNKETYEYDRYLLDENYQVIFSDFDVYWICGRYAATLEDDYFSYYSIETGDLMFRFPIRTSDD